MPRHEAVFRFTTEHAGQIYRSLQPELEDEVNPRSLVTCRMEGSDTLVLTITAQDTSSLRAALNMYLRLVNVADEVTALAGKKAAALQSPDRSPGIEE